MVSPSLSPTLSPESVVGSSWDNSDDDESSPFRYYPLILFVVVILFVVAESFKAKQNPYDDHRHLIRRWQRRHQSNPTPQPQPQPQPPPPEKSNTTSNSNNNNTNNKECAICLEDLKAAGEEECQVALECNHGFHKACIHHWLAQDSHCPLCRRTITNIDNV